MKNSQFIFVLMLGSSFATMARADDTSYAIASPPREKAIVSKSELPVHTML